MIMTGDQIRSRKVVGCDLFGGTIPPTPLEGLRKTTIKFRHDKPAN